MSDRGEPDLFRIVWRNGAVDEFVAHQVTWQGGMASLFSAGPEKPRIITFMAEVDGCWRLMMSAREEDVLTVRNITQVGEAS